MILLRKWTVGGTNDGSISGRKRDGRSPAG